MCPTRSVDSGRYGFCPPHCIDAAVVVGTRVAILGIGFGSRDGLPSGEKAGYKVACSWDSPLHLGDCPHFEG